MSNVLSNFSFLVFCFLAGILLKFFKRLPKETPAVLNGFIFYLSFPAIILLQFHDITFSRDVLMPVWSGWILFLVSLLAFGFLGWYLKLDRKTQGALILTAGLGNTSFVGFPMLEALYGPEALKTGILIDQLGSFLVLASLGVLVASIYSGRGCSFKKIFKRVLAFPPLYALILAIVLRSVPFAPVVREVLSRLGSVITPLALVSVGYQLHLNRKLMRQYCIPLCGGLFYKLIFGPFLITLFYVFVCQVRGEEIQIAIVEGCMAPMITAAIVVAEYGLNSELANLMVGIGIPLSFLTVPIWVRILADWL